MKCSMTTALLALLACLTVVSPATQVVAQAKDRPNIIFLFTDDQNDLSVGCYGNDQVQTPNMDKLGAEGIIFTNHYNTTAICMASRATVMTGQYEYRVGCNFSHGPMYASSWARSYPMLLRKAGYFTGFAGKFGFNIVDKPGAKGAGRGGGGTLAHEKGEAYFDVWAGGQGQTSYETDGKNNHQRIKQYADRYPHVTRAYGAFAGDFFKQAKASGKPFCLSISFKSPHLPFTPDPAFDHVYANKTYRKPANYGVKHAAHLAPQSRTGRQYKSYRFWVDDYQKSIRGYNQLIHGVDVALGMIRKALAEQGLSDNTVIIFTSDNGYSCGAHGFGGKVLPYEEASRSPLIIYDPRQPASQRGQRRDAVTGNIDMAPTIFDLAGLDVPQHMDGKSLLPLIREPKRWPRESIALMNMWGNAGIHTFAVVTRDWKYIYWPYTNDQMQPTEELFHVANDRMESKNLSTVAAHADDLKRMRAVYDEHHTHMRHYVTKFNKYTLFVPLFDRQRKK